MAKKKVVRTRRRERKNVVNGQAHIQSTFNNTIISITRPRRERHLVGLGRRAGLQGQPQVDAVRRPGDRRDDRQEGARARHALDRGLRARSGRRSRGRDPLAAGDRSGGQRNHRRHADPAQRLPSSEAAAGLDGQLQRSRLPLLPPRGRQALPQGRALLHAEVRHRAPRVRARHARPGAQAQDVGLRHAAAREAEGAPHLRPAREAVPQLLRRGGERSRA